MGERLGKGDGPVYQGEKLLSVDCERGGGKKECTIVQRSRCTITRRFPKIRG